MQPVLGLVEDRRLRAVDDLLGDLLAVVRRQAVQDERLLPGLAHEIRVDAVAGEVAPPPLVLGLLAHRRPDVGVEHVRAGDRARGRRPSARPSRPTLRARSRAIGDRALAAARMRPAWPRRRASRTSPRRRAATRRRCCRRRGRRASAPRDVPRRSRIVIRSARIWHGCAASVSAFTTGIDACSSKLLDVVLRERPDDDARRGNARGRRRCRGSSRRAPGAAPLPRTSSAVPPSCAMPTANETRVRVEGFMNRRPIVRPARTRAPRGARAGRASGRPRGRGPPRARAWLQSASFVKLRPSGSRPSPESTPRPDLTALRSGFIMP